MKILFGDTGVEIGVSLRRDSSIFVKELFKLVELNHHRHGTLAPETFAEEISESRYVDWTLLLWALDTIINYRQWTASETKSRKQKINSYIKCVNKMIVDKKLYRWVHETAEQLLGYLHENLDLYRRPRGGAESVYQNAALWFLIYGRKRKNLNRVKAILKAIGHGVELSALKSFVNRHKTSYKLAD